MNGKNYNIFQINIGCVFIMLQKTPIQNYFCALTWIYVSRGHWVVIVFVIGCSSQDASLSHVFPLVFYSAWYIES